MGGTTSSKHMCTVLLVCKIWDNSDLSSIRRTDQLVGVTISYPEFCTIYGIMWVGVGRCLTRLVNSPPAKVGDLRIEMQPKGCLVSIKCL